MKFKLAVPKEFDFQVCFTFLQRSPMELLHWCGENTVRKLIRIDNHKVLIELGMSSDRQIEIAILNATLTQNQLLQVKQYITEWFDLATDLRPFYTLAKNDALLKPLIKRYFGYRIIGQPDLFESLVWAVLGQQINLQFAYLLKQRFVERFGEKEVYEGSTYYLFPDREVVAGLSDEQLLPLQFSRQKSKYTTLIAKAFVSGDISKERLQGLSLQEAKEQLMKIKGVGNWTANYALMKTYRFPNAFPLEDAGIHNALRRLLNLDRKPTLQEVARIFKKYEGWEAYATLYLWKSL